MKICEQEIEESRTRKKLERKMDEKRNQKAEGR